jgi:predicted phosphoribosyltransferase
MENYQIGYKERIEAGKVLAKILGNMVSDRVVVLSLPRGGTIVGQEIASELSAPHDLIICRKVGSPFDPEIAIGALAQDGTFLRDEKVIEALAINQDYIEGQCRIELREIERRKKELRTNRDYPELSGKDIILVDDGIATGFTMESAILSIQRNQDAKIILAVPVGPRLELNRLALKVDQLICPLFIDQFRAVGDYYADFHQVSDEEVREALQYNEEKNPSREGFDSYTSSYDNE